MLLQTNTVVADHMLKHQKLVFEFAITANATPASKKHASDLPGVCFIATEGKLTDISAIENITGLSGYTAPVDNSTGDSVFDVLIKGSELGTIKNVMKITVTEKTALGASYAYTKFGTDGLTAGGNIAFEVNGTGLTLATESPTFVVDIDYVLAK